MSAQKNKPLVSVIIPNFNRAEMLSRAVDSVLEQANVDFELIVVDDASSRPPIEVYEKVRNSGHRVLLQDHNRGPGAARNRGVAESRGKWLAFLDSDDYWLADKLSSQLKSLESTGMRVGQVEEIWFRDGERVNPPKAHKMSGGDILKRSFRSVCVSSSSVMLQKALFLEVGGFDERLFVCEDYALWLRVADRAEFDLLETPLVVKFGGHEDQLSKALLAMDRFRIWALCQGLEDGFFSRMHETAVFELRRKTRILAKGSSKHGNELALRHCQELDELLQSQSWDAMVAKAQELVDCWPTRPVYPRS